jgi:hypothetical protein
MSQEFQYTVKFKAPINKERYSYIVGRLKNSTQGSFFEKDGVDLTFSPCIEDSSGEVERDWRQMASVDFSSVYYQSHPGCRAYLEGYRYKHIFDHYFIIRFFNSLEDVEAVYRSLEDEKGNLITDDDAETLMKYFLIHGYKDDSKQIAEVLSNL